MLYCATQKRNSKILQVWFRHTISEQQRQTNQGFSAQRPYCLRLNGIRWDFTGVRGRGQ